MQKYNLDFSHLKFKKQIKIQDKDLFTFFWYYIIDLSFGIPSIAACNTIKQLFTVYIHIINHVIYIKLNKNIK